MRHVGKVLVRHHHFHAPGTRASNVLAQLQQGLCQALLGALARHGNPLTHGGHDHLGRDHRRVVEQHRIPVQERADFVALPHQGGPVLGHLGGQQVKERPLQQGGAARHIAGTHRRHDQPLSLRGDGVGMGASGNKKVEVSGRVAGIRQDSPSAEGTLLRAAHHRAHLGRLQSFEKRRPEPGLQRNRWGATHGVQTSYEFGEEG